MKSAGIGAKLGVGFGALIAIALALGALAIWNMRQAAIRASDLADEYMPEIDVAHEIERAMLLVRAEVLAYLHRGDAAAWTCV